MASVIERLRELGKEAARAIPGGQTKKVLGPEATKGEVALQKYLHACHLALPALLALADAVESKDPARIESALAELKKEAR